MKADGQPETEFEAAMPLFGAIIQQMDADRTWTENQLQGMMENRVKELQKDYVQLYHAMEKVADKTDARTAWDALERFGWKYSDAVKAIGGTKDAYGDEFDSAQQYS